MGWDTVKSLLGKAAPLIGAALGGPVAPAVGAMMASVLGVENEPGRVAAAIQADPEALVKITAIEREHEREIRRMVLEAETAQLAEINKTMRAEAASNDAYVRRWRPTFGYLTALAWIVQCVAIAWSIVASPEQAGSVAQAITALTPMWGVALAMLGVSISSRSRDKRTAAGQQQDPGVLSKLASGIAAVRGAR